LKGAPCQLASSLPRRSLGSQARFDVRIGGCDQIAKRLGIDLDAWLQFHVPHAFAAALKQPCRIIERRAVEEADIDMTLERVDLPERRIFDASDRTPVVHQLQHVVTAFAHPLEPALRDGPQLHRLMREPRLDSRIALRPSRDAKEVRTPAEPVQVKRKAARFTHDHG
jgi:hypothetical protein